VDTEEEDTSASYIRFVTFGYTPYKAAVSVAVKETMPPWGARAMA
jgi:hypothetical protein